MTASWWSNHATRVASLCYLGLVVLLPSQFGYHFWPDFSTLSGLRIDYLSPTLYLSDLFLLGLTLGLSPLLLQELKTKKRRYVVGSFFLYLFLTSLFSLSPLNSLYSLVRWIGYAVFAIATWYFVKNVQMVQKIVVLLSLGVIYASLLAGGQFLLQHSIGGPFYLMGERTFSGQTPGIANASLNGTLVLRPYASFPHPNVFAGFVLISFWLIWSYRLIVKGRWQRVVVALALVLGPLGILLSLSRTAVILWGILLLLSFHSLIKKSKQAVWLISIVVFVGVIFTLFLLPRFMTLSLQDEAVSLRFSLLVQSWEILLTAPLFGVGLKNFLVVLATFPLSSVPYSTLQPVHNIFVLLVVEIGLLGLIWVLPWLFTAIKRIKNEEREIRVIKYGFFVSVIGIGLVDHYFYTLHQGQLLLALVLGILWQKNLPSPSFPLQKKQISRKRLKKSAQQ